MKTKYINIILAASQLSITGACSDNDYTELDKGSTELAITAGASDLVLNETNHALEAIDLSWTTGNNYGTGNAISYTLELAETGSDFHDPYIPVNDQQQVYFWKPTVEELNDILLNHFDVRPGDGVSLEARVTASVAGDERVQTAVTAFSAVSYQPVTPTLYILGDASPNGWNANAATEMQRTDNGKFTWTGDLSEGDLKFITTLGSFLPSYNNDGHGGLVYRLTDDQPDGKFHIEEAHCYRIDVNLLDMTISFTQTEGVVPQFDHLYLVGNETDWGFRPMTQDPLDPFLFRIGIFFEKGGEFKFGTSDGSWENMYKATTSNAPYTDSEMELVKGFDPDNKWFLNSSETGLAYKICLDIRSGAERMMMRQFTPFSEMYLVGNATPNGWNLADATPMTMDAANPNVFTWSGHLNVGELKFSADKQDDWNGAWFMAASDGENPTGAVQKVIFINKSDNACQEQYKDLSTGGIDLKWKITEAGNYTITLDQLLEEVTISKN
jgi:hypothetical protein